MSNSDREIVPVVIVEGLTPEQVKSALGAAGLKDFAAYPSDIEMFSPVLYPLAAVSDRNDPLLNEHFNEVEARLAPEPPENYEFSNRIFTLLVAPKPVDRIRRWPPFMAEDLGLVVVEREQVRAVRPERSAIYTICRRFALGAGSFLDFMDSPVQKLRVHGLTPPRLQFLNHVAEQVRAQIEAA